MYVECDNENKYKIKAYDLIQKLDYDTQKKACIAIDDLFESDNEISWQWIATALTKKSPENFNKYGFGLMFNHNFYASVLEQIERDERANEINVYEFFTGDSYE